MYAIVEIAGKQFRVEKDMKLKVPSLGTEPGKKVEFDQVLMLADDKGKITYGTPTVAKTVVSATVVEHGRDAKIIVFKKKRRKGYQKKNGHRQGFTLIEVNSIGAGKAPAKKAEPKAKSEKAEVKAEKKQPAVKKAAAEKKPATPKKSVKPVAEKKATKASTAKKTEDKKAAPKKKAAAKTTAKKAPAKKAVKTDKPETKEG